MSADFTYYFSHNRAFWIFWVAGHGWSMSRSFEWQEDSTGPMGTANYRLEE